MGSFSHVFPRVVQLELASCDPLRPPGGKWTEYICHAVSVGPDGSSWACLQDSQGEFRVLNVGHGSNWRMQMKKRKVIDFLGECDSHLR